MTFSAERTGFAHNLVFHRLLRLWRWSGLWGLSHLWSHFFLHVLVGECCDMTIAIVGQHVVNYLCYLYFQFLNKLSWIILLGFYVAKFLLPYASQLTAFQQFFLYGVNEFNACRSGYKVFPFTLYIPSFK